MSASQRVGAIMVAGIGVIGGCAAPAAQPAALPAAISAPPPAARVIVHVRGVPDGDGRVIVGLCADPARWLTEAGYDVGATALAQPGDTVVTIDDVAPGRYAMSVFHDADGDAKLDRGAFGLPIEAWGFANNPRTLGPASFQQSAIDVTTPETVVEITLRPPLRSPAP